MRDLLPKLSIKAKLILGFVLGSFAFFIAGIFIFFSGQRITRMAVNYENILMIDNTLREIDKGVGEAIKFSAPQKLQDALPLFDELETYLGKFRALGLKVAFFEDEVKKYKELIRKASQSDSGFDPEILSQLTDYNLKVREGYDKLKGSYSERIRNIVAMQNLSVILSIVLSLIFLSIIGFLYSSNVSRAILRVSRSLSGMAKGASDLTKRIKVETQDEMGQLAQNFNSFLDKLREIVSQVVSTVNDLYAFVDENYKLVENFYSAISTQLDEIARISTSAEQFSSTISESAKNLSSISHFTEEAGRSFAEGSKEIISSLTGIQELSYGMQNVISGMKRVEEIQKKIKDFVSGIMDITEQTNLLSLNASIEAARAGEHGKGFAVVAEEVRRLAGRTSQMAKEISQIVSKFTDEMNKAMSSINEISLKVHENAQKASENVAVLQKVTQNFSKIKEQVSAIATSFEEQERTSAEISRSITYIAQSLENSRSSLLSIKERISELKVKAQKLLDLVKNFKY
ncbi:MAG: methyl-accepting chemotaxis protein [Candidatus Calescibacterium sp.]|jgi:methyl-accepting chemotaxis protein|nr:methyl-accepting chemotaxis protein [Candidatus Calescibacterium sp.]